MRSEFTALVCFTMLLTCCVYTVTSLCVRLTRVRVDLSHAKGAYNATLPLNTPVGGCEPTVRYACAPCVHARDAGPVRAPTPLHSCPLLSLVPKRICQPRARACPQAWGEWLGEWPCVRRGRTRACQPEESDAGHARQGPHMGRWRVARCWRRGCWC